MKNAVWRVCHVVVCHVFDFFLVVLAVKNVLLFFKDFSACFSACLTCIDVIWHVLSSIIAYLVRLNQGIE